MNDDSLDDNKLITERKDKLSELRKKGNPYPNNIKPSVSAIELLELYGNYDNIELEQLNSKFKICGRLMAKRVMGKLSFLRIDDGSGIIQLCLKKDFIGEEAYSFMKSLDVGDILTSEGSLFRTKTNELSIRSITLGLISKCLRPLPEKFHGIADQELRNRRRYLDLITSEASKKVFTTRFHIIRAIRDWFHSKGYLEVETPMMHPIAGGASARPFVTHHNSLDMDLFLRIAPELYLKRLIVGGYPKVFEINRSFRNEGVSTQHNPEFTMLESYEAYADYHSYMDLVEELFSAIAKILDKESLMYQENEIKLSEPFVRIPLESLLISHIKLITQENVRNIEVLRGIAKDSEIKLTSDWGLGKIQLELFEALIEASLKQPTFVIDYPVEVSPLARKKDTDPFLTDRFELFIAGREIANGFSELNDPEDQASRFTDQVSKLEAGDSEAMLFDFDYIRALEYGMPPAAGLGIGIDRMVMLFCDAATIKDVILFPHMRAEKF
jgi:lysyl-tRNA synthetase class 2